MKRYCFYSFQPDRDYHTSRFEYPDYSRAFPAPASGQCHTPHFQDSEGLMWYGTVNGLCCDDGYQINVIRSDINTPGLLNDNTIQSIAEDERGRIWFGTDHGAYMLDKPADRLHRWTLNGYRQVLSTTYGKHPTGLCG